MICVKEGGPSPDSNRQLKLLMREAQTLGVSKDVVDRNIKKASDASAVDYKELTYEVYGVGGVGFIVNCLSDNNNRAAAQFNAAVNKLEGFKVAASGSVLFNFEKKGRLAITTELSEEDAFEIAIEADVDDLEMQEPDEDKGDKENIKAVILVEAADLGKMQAALQDKDIECASSLVNVPMSLIECSEEDLELNLAGLDKLEELEDCDSVEHNLLVGA